MFKANKDNLLELITRCETIHNLQKVYIALKIARHLGRPDKIIQGEHHMEDACLLLRDMKERHKRPGKIKTLALCGYLKDYGQEMYNTITHITGKDDFFDSDYVFERDQFIKDSISFVRSNY